MTTGRKICPRSAWLALLAGALLLLSPAFAQATASSFDHATSGFELNGQHRAVACESCHTGGIFKGTPTTCVACHAPGSRIGATAKPTNHILASSDCGQCHTTFGWRPVARFDHRNVIGTCSSCHNNVQTVGKSPNHLTTSVDCGACHSVRQPWSMITFPSNHIPTASTALCTDCHTGSSFSVVPSITNIHRYAPSTSANCAQCHGAAAPSFAIPAIGFSIVGLPSGHVPLGTNTACESCHVGASSSIAATPVVDGAKFTGSAMSHAGITTCVSCHGPTITAASFYGITKLVVMPATSPMGAAAHVPTGTACESCHAGSMPTGLVPGNATKSVPGTGFATPAPTTAQIHAGIASNCASCHEGAYQWVDVITAYPLNPATLTAGVAQFFGFQTRPGKTASGTSLVDAAHPTSGDCSKCHTRTDYFEGQLKPANHIPTAPTATCTNCHKSTDFSVTPALLDIHNYAPSTTANCTQCHGSTTAPTFAIPAANFAIVTTPANHMPTTAACESCHVGASSSVTATPVPNGAKFANSAMNHAGLTTCAGCHGPTITGASFVGISRIIVMPATAPVGPSAHIPAPTTCESCHLGSMPVGQIPAIATKPVPGSAFATPAPTTAQIHAGVSGGCASCHEAPYQWVDMATYYTITPSVLMTGAKYTGFQTRPGAAAGTFIVADAAHPTNGDCSQCHSGNFQYFDGNVKPPNHIPTLATAVCTDCHKSTNFSVIPALIDIHTYAPSTTSNCTQCHGSATAPTFAIPAAGFKIVTTPANHIPTTAACESCHVGAGSSVAATPVPNGSTFKSSAMNHAGITTCVSCHGPTVTGTTFYGVTRIVAMPATSPAGPGAHIPSGTACESCHQGSMPVGLVPAVATRTVPGTLFATPAPTTAQIHAGVSGGCASCHEAPYQWVDMATYYTITPSVLMTGAKYTGFQTRPGAAAGTFIVADAAHPTSGDCSQCHAGNFQYFDGNVKPANHIPTAATAVCTDCHKSQNFSVIPALIDIHTYAPSTSANCTQCHGSATAPTFAIPAAGFTIVTTPANHVPTTASCEVCHVGAGSSVAVTPVPNGAKFANSAMGHAGITNCVSCHGPTLTGASFVGITKLTVMPPTTPVGAGSHIPSATACETCHQGSMPAGLVPANAARTAPGTLFATPVPTTAMIHGSITSGCTSCHESTYVWMDVSRYPIAPAILTSGAQYIGFQTRPTAAGGTYAVPDAAHPATGDCVTCHGANFNYFSAQAEPSNHIPTLPGAACSVCHTTPGNFAVYTANLNTLHTEVSTACSTCHADGKGPFAGAPGFAIVQRSTRGTHIPITRAAVPVECSGCHQSVTAFSGTIMSHMAIGDSANSAAGNACDACHEFGFDNRFYGININFTRNSPSHFICGAPGTPTAPNVRICGNGGSDCLTGCHQHNNIPSTFKVARAPRAVAPATGATPARTPATGTSVAGEMPLGAARTAHANTGGRPCQSCHNGIAASGKSAAHLASSGACADCHSTLAWRPVARVDHVDVLGRCVSCHNGKLARAKAARHPLSGTDCDSCHTTSAWTPAAFDHGSVIAGTCASCHNAVAAPGKPAGHVATALSCDSCHYTLGWLPLKSARHVAPGSKPSVRPPGAPRPRQTPTPRLP